MPCTRDVRPGPVVLLFPTTQAVLQGEDALLEAGIDVDVVPKPEGVRRLCGIALEVDRSALDAAAAVLDGLEIPFDVYEEETDE